MHPPLIPERHPLCAEFIEALTRCHKEHAVSMWWGACNDPKFALARCLADEKKQLRAERQEKAKAEFRRRKAETEAAAERRRLEQEGAAAGQQQQ